MPRHPEKTAWVPATAAEAQMNRVYKTLSKSDRMKRAVARVMDEGWVQLRAAREYGVSKSQLNLNVRQERERRAGMADRVSAARAEDAGLTPRGETSVLVETSPNGEVPRLVILDETNRVPSFDEFDRIYFGNLVCPDCGVHHETPKFHQEIMDVVGGADKRVLIQLPPYHSKSVLVTVKSTLWELCRNPNSRHAIVSKSQRLAEKFLHAIATYLTNPGIYEGAERNLIEDWGPFQESTSQWNKQQIYVAGRMTAEKDPSVSAFGVGSAIYGVRAERFIFDDIADQENQRNPERVAEMFRWATVEAASRVGRNGKLLFVGTRVAPGDIYSEVVKLPGYRVVRYPCITDEEEQTTLWGEHFPFSAATTMRDSMNPQDWQLVYQNVDTPGFGASFTPEIVESCHDMDRVIGQYDPRWQLVIGLDPAGGGEQSGYTAMILEGVDVQTGKRFLVDMVNVKQMKAPQMRDQLFAWCDTYPVTELRVEVNGLQRQLIQYNEELIQHLTRRGVRVVPHVTSRNNKWDAQFGVESMAPLFYNNMISIPWGSIESRHRFGKLCDQLIQFPMGQVSDLVMALWFADLGCREISQRQAVPMFDPRMKVPDFVRKRRAILDFADRSVKPWVEHDRDGLGHPRGPKMVKLANVGGEILIY